MSSADNKKTFEVGDLVVFSGISQSIIKNQIGIVIGDNFVSTIKEDMFQEDEWYVVQFGSMKLIVSQEMIERLEPADE